MVGCGLAILPVYITKQTQPFGDEFRSLLNFSLTLALILGGIMIGFNGWNWYLCLLGDSTIEFWKLKAKKLNANLYDPRNPEYQRFENMRDNIFKAFGTRNFLYALLPSMRDLPFFGHEWTIEVFELDAETSALEEQEIRRESNLDFGDFDAI